MTFCVYKSFTLFGQTLTCPTDWLKMSLLCFAFSFCLTVVLLLVHLLHMVFVVLFTAQVNHKEIVIGTHDTIQDTDTCSYTSDESLKVSF